MAAINDTTKTALIQLLTLQQQQMAILQALLGGATVTAAAVAPGSVAGSKKSGKGSRGPRGSSGWDLFKKQVRKEMSDANPGVKYKLKEVADECQRRKEAGEYDEAHWKSQAAAAKVAGSTSDAESEGDGENASTDSKKRGRPKGSKNKAKTVAVAVAAPVPVAAPAIIHDEAKGDDEEDDDEVDAVEWTFKGKKYFKSSANEVWENISGAPGELKGRYNALTNKIEPV